MKDAYQRALTGCCRDDVDPQWLPRTCCTNHSKYDKRTPGLFKLEYEDDVMIELCSKTYIIQKFKTVPTSNTRMAAFRPLRRDQKLPVKRLVHRPQQVREVKFSSKGITKRRVNAPMTTFRHVLNTQRVGHGTLKGFRARKNGIATIFASQGLRFGSPFSSPLADLEYILKFTRNATWWFIEVAPLR